MYSFLMNESLKNLIIHRVALFKALIIPFILLTMINMIFDNFMIYDEVQGRLVFANEEEKYLVYFLLFLTFLINISIAVSVHRILLINEDISPWQSIKTTKREWKFFFKSFLIFLFGALTFLLIFFFSTALLKIFIANFTFPVSLLLSLIFTLIVISRISIVLPAIATDEELGFYEAFSITKNYKFLSFYMVGIFPTIISVLVFFVYGLIINFLTVVVSNYFELLYSLLNMFITAFVISCLSVTYKYLKEESLKNIEQIEE